MFRRALDSLVKFVTRKELVGVDRNGNKYYRYGPGERPTA